jgi:PIN domain nuclease of toxin-antitoxin system
MRRIVLDASVVLALLNRQPGAEMLTAEPLSEAATSTVNLAEVHKKLISEGGDPDEAGQDALSPIREVFPFTAEHARIAGALFLQPADKVCHWVTAPVWRLGLP